MNTILTLIDQPEEYGAIFNGLKYRFEQLGTAAISFSNDSGFLRIETSQADQETIENSGGRIFLYSGSFKKPVSVTEYSSSGGSYYAKTDLLYSLFTGSVVVRWAIPEAIRFTLTAGFSNAWIAGSEAQFPEKPAKVLATFDVSPNPISGEYTFDAGPILRSYNLPASTISQGLTSSVSLGYRIGYTKTEGASNTFTQFATRFGFYSAARSLTAFSSGLRVPFNRLGAINFKDKDGFALPCQVSFLSTTFKAVENLRIDPVILKAGTSASFDILTGAKYYFVFELPSTLSGTVSFNLPAFVQYAPLQGDAANQYRFLINPPFGSSSGGSFNPLEFDPDDFDVSATAAGSYEIKILENGADAATADFNLIESARVRNVDACEDPLILAWLNAEGGFSSYVFRSYKETFQDFDQEATFTDSNRILRKSQVKGYRKALRVRSGVVSAFDREFIKDLMFSSVVFAYDANTGVFDIPVFIPSNAFTWKKDRFVPTESQFEFVAVMAQEENLQTL